MATKSTQKTTKASNTRTIDFDDFELRNTMQEFLQEEPKDGQGVLNFATISGFVMLFIGLTFLLQLIGLNIGPDLSPIIEMLPLIGGVLVTLVGFGFFVGDRKAEEEAKRKDEFTASVNSSSYSYNYDVHGSDSGVGSKTKKGGSKTRFANDLDDFEQFAPKSSQYESQPRQQTYIDSYGYRSGNVPKNKLYKSRTDKKLAGVCGGLAKYFGISPTAVRLLFVLATLMWGVSPLIYIGLAVAMPKEPYDLMDDYNF